MGGCLSSQTPKPPKQYVLKNYKPIQLYDEPSTTPDFGITDIYEVEEMLGEGGTGQTWLCKDKESGKKVAVKFIQRPIPKILIPLVTQEIQIQAAVADGHVNLVKIETAVLTKSHLGIVMEYVRGGNLTAYVSARGSTLEDRNGLFLSENEARYFFKQFVGAVEHLHHSHIAHRDLKLDNVVLTRDYPPIIKVCDFGFAKDFDESSNMLTSIGTPVYMSPQQLCNSKPENAKAYDATASDVWACGVLLFVMMLGLFPYDHLDNPDPNSSQAHAEVWLQQIKHSWRESDRVACHVEKLSTEVVDLLDRIFELDESKRISIAGIKMHPWFSLPMPMHFENALDNLDARQRVIEMQLKNSEKIQIRDSNVEILVREAGIHAPASTGTDEDFNVKWVVLSALERQRSLQNSPVFVGSRRGGTFHKSNLQLSPSTLSLNSYQPGDLAFTTSVSDASPRGGSNNANRGEMSNNVSHSKDTSNEKKTNGHITPENNINDQIKKDSKQETSENNLHNVSKKTLLELNGSFRKQNVPYHNSEASEQENVIQDTIDRVAKAVVDISELKGSRGVSDVTNSERGDQGVLSGHSETQVNQEDTSGSDRLNSNDYSKKSRLALSESPFVTVQSQITNKGKGVEQGAKQNGSISLTAAAGDNPANTAVVSEQEIICSV